MWKVFIGWDPAQAEAAEVCKYTLLKHSTLPVQVNFLRLKDLKEQKLIWKNDPAATTETTMTRWLVPHLSNYHGWSLYVDPDFVFFADIRELFQSQEPRYATMVVKTPYKPKSTTRLDGRVTAAYGRKCWSSLMLFNCEHPKSKQLTPEYINNSNMSNLHRMDWANTNEIGGISEEWQVIPGHTDIAILQSPIKALHYTEGGPWTAAGRSVPYGWYYGEALQQLKQSQQITPAPKLFDALPQDITNLFTKIVNYRHDPAGQYYGDSGYKQIIKELEMLDNKACVAVEADTEEEASDKLEAKGQNYDPFLKSFIIGSGGQISVWDKTSASQVPVVVRGVTKRKQMDACRKAGRDFYYIDTGYFGNGRKKTYHRITKNNMQYLGEVRHRDRDRLASTGVSPRKFRPGANILLAPPSQKLLMCYDIDLDRWLEDTIAQIRLYTDREIIVRNKASRSVRQSTDTMEMALERNVHCLVTFSSIAAVEALCLGKPAIVLGPSAAAPVCSQSLKDIENPFIPSLDEVEEWLANLAYCQFTEPEMRDGTAWRILNDN
jgi:lipopolysaccharide biosynthesis glycosyltransferase